MPIPSSVKLDFSASATNAASKKYPKWKSNAPLLETAANEVLRKELPKIQVMKLGIVFMTDPELLQINKDVMKHDYFTDILTFEIERAKNHLEAELYISLDRASENAHTYKVTLRNELARLTIHGMLHLARYDDKTTAGKKRMRERERFFLEQLAIDLSF